MVANPIKVMVDVVIDNVFDVCTECLYIELNIYCKQVTK